MTATARSDRPKLWWSHHSLERRSFRWWSYWRGRDFLSIETSWLSGGLSVGLQILHGQWTASLRLGVASLHVSLPGGYRNYGDDREIHISVHSGALWWAFWTDPLSWSSTTPKWRQGNFNPADFVLGRRSCTNSLIEARDVLVPMPERAYSAKAELREWVWRRPRWPFAMRVKRVSIELPEGIPFPGKGENSWDCGDDATFGITTGPCSSIAEGVGVLVGSVLKDRVRHGGWDSWTWKRAAPADKP